MKRKRNEVNGELTPKISKNSEKQKLVGEGTGSTTSNNLANGSVNQQKQKIPPTNGRVSVVPNDQSRNETGVEDHQQQAHVKLARATRPAPEDASSNAPSGDSSENSEDDRSGSSESDEDPFPKQEPQDTPSKKRVGRPKGSKRQRSASPPPDGPPQEHYFFQNRPHGAQASNNTLPSSALLNHDQYFDALRRYKDPHQDEIEFLLDLYAKNFKEWEFKLEEGFNLCLFGWGSKRRLLNGFAKYLSSSPDEEHQILVVNGYHHSISIRDVLSNLASMIPSLRKQKLSGQPTEMATSILKALEAHFSKPHASNVPDDNQSLPNSRSIYILIHSLDWQNLRRPSLQPLLARLASSPFIRLVVSTDKPNVHVLWDLSLKSQFNFLFHDTTTFQPYDIEMSGAAARGGVVDEVNALLGRSGRKLRGREGVLNVLLSLTESARRLYGMFIAELLSVEGEDEGEGVAEVGNTAMATQVSAELPSISYRALKQKATQQLIATGEMQFRQLLKEFFEHEMLTTKLDAAGTEILSVPFRREECEAILEDMAMED